MLETEWRHESLRIAGEIQRRAAELGTGAAEYAVAWVLKNRLVQAVIAGPRTLTQWQPYVDALGLTLTAADEALVNSLVPAGHSSSPGYTDPGHPIEGRVT